MRLQLNGAGRGRLELLETDAHDLRLVGTSQEQREEYERAVLDACHSSDGSLAGDFALRLKGSTSVLSRILRSNHKVRLRT